jgi:amino acid transporter
MGLVMYVFPAVALPVFYRREHPDEFNWFRHLVVPAVALVIILAALWSLVSPAPAEPIVYALPAAVVWLIVGVGVVMYLRSRHPDRLAVGQRIFVPDEAE